MLRHTHLWTLCVYVQCLDSACDFKYSLYSQSPNSSNYILIYYFLIKISMVPRVLNLREPVTVTCGYSTGSFWAHVFHHTVLWCVCAKPRSSAFSQKWEASRTIVFPAVWTHYSRPSLLPGKYQTCSKSKKMKLYSHCGTSLTCKTVITLTTKCQTMM